jgi:hypothetical protein
MLNSPVLDVVIGLIFFYCTLSLLVSAIQERISALSSMRSRDLERWVVSTLGQADAARFYAHPLIAGLGGPKASYIPSQTFAMALFDTFNVVPSPAAAVAGAAATVAGDPLAAAAIAGAVRQPIANISNDRVRTALLSHFDHAAGDVAEARGNVEGWFDSAMERVSGAYKRRVHWYVLAIAATLALAINADTLRVASSLYRDPVMREAFAERAREIGVQDSGAKTEDLKALVAGVPLPLGWPGDAPQSGGWPLFILSKIVGVLLTVFAISLGAPFWFDLLNRVVNLRAAGPPPAKSAQTEGPRS